MSKLDDLSAWKVFLSLSRTRNLSTTAAEFDVEVSTISRAIGSLEKALGHGLIERNTRPLKLTEAGKHAAEMMSPILDMHAEVVQELLSKNTSLSGRIRISHAQGFVEKCMMPMILEFNSMYPDISFEVVGNGSLTDVLEYRADMAIISFPNEQSRPMPTIGFSCSHEEEMFMFPSLLQNTLNNLESPFTPGILKITQSFFTTATCEPPLKNSATTMDT